MKIKDFKEGESVTVALLVKSAQIRYTRPPGNKPYLDAIFTDGTDDIKAVDWNYGTKKPPEQNAIADLTADVSTYNGAKQLNIKSISRNNHLSVAAFAPQGDVDPTKYVMEVERLRDSVTHTELYKLTRDILTSAWDIYREVPAANSIHHAYVHGLMKHSVDVTLKARALALLIDGDCDIDLVTAGALVHDIGKIITYRLNGAVIEFTEAGNMFEHIVEGIKYTERFRTERNSGILDLLQHIIASHHGRLEYGSPMEPKFLEAHIICAADGIDAKVATILEANAKSKLEDVYTDKIWVLGNKPQFTQHYVADILHDAINWDEEHPLDPIEVDGE